MKIHGVHSFMLLRCWCDPLARWHFKMNLNSCSCSKMSKSVEQIIRNWQSLEDYLECFSVHVHCLLSSKYCECQCALQKKEGKMRETDEYDNGDSMKRSWIMKWNAKVEEDIFCCCHSSACSRAWHSPNTKTTRPLRRNWHRTIHIDQKWSPSTRIIYSIETKTDLSTIHIAGHNLRETWMYFMLVGSALSNVLVKFRSASELE